MKVNLLGVRIDAMGRWDAMRTITRRLASGRQTAIYTPNPIMVRRAMTDKAFAAVLNRGDLNIADGVGLTLGARIMGLPPLPRIAGIDFGEDILTYAARAGLRVFLLGGKPGVAHQAALALNRRFPAPVICGIHHGYFDEGERAAILRQIRAAHADILLVCLGSPRQERWIDQNRDQLAAVKLFMGLGGALDVWSGNLSRAPRFVSKMGIEWAWRMARQPRRLKGLFPITAFLLSALASRKTRNR